MPDLKIYSPSRTEIPQQQARRRVWAAPAVSSHSAVILTPARLYLAPGSGPVKAETVAAAEGGADVEQLFGPLTVVVNLPTVVRAGLDLETNTVRVEFTGDAGRPGMSRVSATFADAETADGVFTKLWRRLGEGWSVRPVRTGNWDSRVLPAAVLTGILLATAGIALVASVAQDGSPHTTGVARLLDWRFVCSFGGVLAAAAQVWLYRRATQPASRLELVRG